MALSSVMARDEQPSFVPSTLEVPPSCSVTPPYVPYPLVRVLS